MSFLVCEDPLVHGFCWRFLVVFWCLESQDLYFLLPQLLNGLYWQLLFESLLCVLADIVYNGLGQVELLLGTGQDRLCGHPNVSTPSPAHPSSKWLLHPIFLICLSHAWPQKWLFGRFVSLFFLFFSLFVSLPMLLVKQ